MHSHHHVAWYGDLTPRTFITAIAAGVCFYGTAFLLTYAVRSEAPGSPNAALVQNVGEDEPWLLAPDEDDCSTPLFRNHSSCRSNTERARS